jgi:superfamily II DNA helicase RecQ
MMCVVSFIKEKADTFERHERILGFVQSRQEAEALAHLLGCEHYHGKLNETAREQALQSWQGNFGSPVLIATNALGAGVDCNVRLVFHYGSPRNHIDQSQEDGRVGRDGKLAQAITFWDVNKFAPKLKAGESDVGVKEQQAWLRTDQCLRIVTGEFLDGRGQSCIDLSTVALCGWCSAQVRPKVMTSESILGSD